VVREAEDRDLGIGVRDLIRVDPADVRDHEIGRVDAVNRDEVVARQKTLELPVKEEVDPREQDRGHVARVTLSILLPKRLTPGCYARGGA
jgi:hypothetical protein